MTGLNHKVPVGTVVRNENWGDLGTDLQPYLNAFFNLKPKEKYYFFLKDHSSNSKKWLWVTEWGVLPVIKKSGKEIIKTILMGGYESLKSHINRIKWTWSLKAHS